MLEHFHQPLGLILRLSYNGQGLFYMGALTLDMTELTVRERRTYEHPPFLIAAEILDPLEEYELYNTSSSDEDSDDDDSIDLGIDVDVQPPAPPSTPVAEPDPADVDVAPNSPPHPEVHDANQQPHNADDAQNPPPHNFFDFAAAMDINDEDVEDGAQNPPHNFFDAAAVAMGNNGENMGAGGNVANNGRVESCVVRLAEYMVKTSNLVGELHNC